MEVCFKLRVCSGLGIRSGDRIFSRLVEMPFVPPVGMEVIERDWSATVESLVYSDGQVIAFAEPDRVPGFGSLGARGLLRTEEEMDELTQQYIKDGWQLSCGLLKP